MLTEQQISTVVGALAAKAKLIRPANLEKVTQACATAAKSPSTLVKNLLLQVSVLGEPTAKRLLRYNGWKKAALEKASKELVGKDGRGEATQGDQADAVSFG